jgi:LuxR family maltose regulon positive regulatory protein
MWELSAADLRMTRGEGADMLRAAGVELDTAEAAMVVEQTEGWAAAIYLASLVLRDPATAAVDVAPRADDEGLVEYVRDEVLAGADPADAEFLLRSSVLDDLTPDICDAVLHRADSAARLRDLARADLFVAASDTHRGAYRIHGLFRVMLQAQLRATDHRLALELHRRACAAYRTAGDLERATRHAVVAGDVPSAADLIWEAAPDLISQGRTATLRRRCSWLSQDDLVAHPQAMVARGWAALEDGEAELAAHCAAVACGADPQRTTSDGECIQAIGLLLRASIGAGGRTQALEDAARADAALQPDSPLRSPAAYIIGALSMLDGDPERARTRLVDAEQRAAGHLTTADGLSLSQQALLDLEEGHWGRAERLADRAWAAQRNSEVRDYTTQALAVSVRALTLAHGGARSAGREEADRAARGLALLQPVIPWLALQTQLVLARARAELGDADQARALLRESLDAMDDDTSPLLRIWADRLTAQLNPYGDEADVATLSTAELRILQYLPTHLSLQEIGDRLHVSRNTVKTHAGAIYRKLGAASRSAAVDRGRELGLLE